MVVLHYLGNLREWRVDDGGLMGRFSPGTTDGSRFHNGFHFRRSQTAEWGRGET